MTAQQLKNSILQMAVQGKLVPQDPNDEPASVLLERIRAEKAAMVKAGKIKKEKNPSVIFRGADNLPYEKVGNQEPVCIADEVPFEIPESWEWVRHNDYFEISGGSQPPKAKFISEPRPGYVRLYQIRDYGKSPIPVYIPASTATKVSKKGDILLARYGASLGKVFWAEEGAYNVAMAKVVPLYNSPLFIKEFLYFFYQSDLYRKIIFGNSRSAQAGFNKEDLSKMWMPVPPIAEQKRIVDKLNQVIPLVDSYEGLETTNDEFTKLFPDQLKKSILQLAVQGKLVPQDPNDEPASVLLERIRAEKEQLIKAGKIKRDKHESVIYRRDNSHYEMVDGKEKCIDNEITFEIPESWTWVRLYSLVSKEIKRGKSPKYSAQRGIQVFAQKCNVKSGGIDMTLAKYLDPSVFGKYPREEYLQDQDIIINSTGNGTLGRIGIFQDTDRIDDSVIVPDSHVTTVRLLPRLNRGYLLYVLKYYQPYLEKQGTGSTNQTELRPSIIAELLIPVPPEAEQDRILRKIDATLPSLNGL